VNLVDADIDRFPLAPPLFETIRDEVAGLFRVAEQEPRLLDGNRTAVQLEQAKRHQHGFGGHVVIDSLQGLSPTSFAAPGEVADFDFSLGIKGDA
jgi:hypothetical protein